MLLVGVAIDPVHAGAGRAPGIVDLPVQRDSLGYPLVYASSVKGALKALCIRSICGSGIDEDSGVIKCSQCSVCCCLFGPEPGEGDKGPGALAILDLVPLFIPTPSSEFGYLYLTTSVLLSRTTLILEVLGENELANSLSKLASEAERLGRSQLLVVGEEAKRGLKSNYVTIGTTPLEAKVLSEDVLRKINLSKLENLLREKLGGLAGRAMSRLVIASPQDGVSLIERSLIRVTRIALRRDRKVVKSGALWTEEYLPYGTIFITGAVDTGFRNDYCVDSQDLISKLKEVLKPRNGVFYVTIGGKETVGRGMIKFTIATEVKNRADSV